MADSYGTITVNIAGLKATKLLVWSLEHLALEMHAQNDPYAKQLAEIHNLARLADAANDANVADEEDFK
jgi:hypothetical protein